jgi:hypothetical protein
MTNIFTLDKFDGFSEKINIDELYEKKRQADLNKLNLFKKILNRIHIKIKNIPKYYKHEKCCWYVIPEIILGVPKYDNSGCIAYVMNQLTENGFKVKYFHPNTLFISWDHWIPSYVRSEFKNKTGIIINEFGEKIEEKNEDEEDELGTGLGPGSGSGLGKDIQQIKNSKKYTPINSYKPSGKLVYSEDLLNKIENKFTK